MVDYLIVGLGLAGIAFCERLEQHGKTFVVINDDSQTSSNIAGGLYNPVILKRFSLAWKANEQLEMVSPFYKALEDKLGESLDHKVPVLRIFASVEEQNLWFEAADKIKLEPFLSTQLLVNKNPCLNAPFGFGEVLHTGRVDTKRLAKLYS
ncbi:MAG: FAD-dependent oxidoreductase, partial [Eudoraea sp.]|nr:FAD-dependent oxidoreductase [Eudoraea sp.]